MADEFSFDVVSKVDLQAVDEAVANAMKEIANRFDFRGSMSKIEFDRKESRFNVASEDAMKLTNVVDILNMRLAKRGVPLKNLKAETVEPALGGTVKQVIKLQQGIPSDKAKELVAEIKKAGIKVQASIQGDQLRVTSKSKDALQATMTFLGSKSFGVDLQFTNRR